MIKLDNIKLRVASILGHGKKHDKITEYFDIFIELLVLINVVAVIVESFENIYTRYKLQLDTFEVFTVTIFTLEFLLRIWIADIAYPSQNHWKSIKKYLTSANAMIDVLTIIPFYIPYLFQIDLRHLRVLRLIRLLRVFKLTKYSHAMVLIGNIIREKKQELLATLLLVFSVLVLASSIMYYVERDAQPDTFPNILYAFWWGIITLTTVGYGDTYPITAVGKIIGGIVALMGVLIVAIPTGIISSSFVQKMEETKNQKRLKEIRNKLKEAFYKKYIPQLECSVRRGQISVDAVKINLELSENDVYKIAEGKNDFRFRNRKIFQNGKLIDKLYLEYRVINASYGTFNNKNHKLTLVSPESLNKQSIGYLTYCISEKLNCNYISNEYFGDESSATEESFGDSGLEPETAFCFRHNISYIEKYENTIPIDFIDWKNDLKIARLDSNVFIVLNTFDKDQNKTSSAHFTYLKNMKINEKAEYTFKNLDKVEKLKEAIIVNSKAKFGLDFTISENDNFNAIAENNILLYINQNLDAEVLLINICQDYIDNEYLFPMAAILADSFRDIC